MRSVEVTQKTLEEAKAEAARLLEVPEEELTVEVLEEPRRLLGFLGGTECRIKATVTEQEAEGADEPQAPQPEEAPAPHLEQSREPAEQPAADAHTDPDGSTQDMAPSQVVADNALEFLQHALALMPLEAEATLQQVAAEEVCIEITGADAGDLIGRYGATLDALQLLTASIANRGLDDGARVVLDAEGYRRRRREMLEGMAHTHAAQAKETGQEVVIKDLKPYERRLIHLALKEDPDVETYSEGEGNDRHLVISPKT